MCIKVYAKQKKRRIKIINKMHKTQLTMTATNSSDVVDGITIRYFCYCVSLVKHITPTLSII